jgi:hypothetical protein
VNFIDLEGYAGWYSQYRLQADRAQISTQTGVALALIGPFGLHNDGMVQPPGVQ